MAVTTGVNMDYLNVMFLQVCVFAYLSIKSSVFFFWMLSAWRSSQMISSRANDNAMKTNNA